MTAPETAPAERHMGEGLLPCPFCGGEPLVLPAHPLPKQWSIACKRCDAKPGAAFTYHSAAIAWNTRAATPTALPSAEDVVALIERIDAELTGPPGSADNRRSMLATARMFLALQSPRASDEVPAGMVLVPSEPTEAMLEAGEQARIDNTDRYLDGSEVARDVVPAIWEAMINVR